MRVVIVGAGLSGLSLAAFLRALNIDCVVLEQAAFLQATYVPPYTLYANALSCFKAYGMDFLFTRGAGVEPEEWFGVKSATGRWLARVRNRNVSLDALGTADMIPLSTAPKANSESIVSQRLAEQERYAMGLVPLRCTFVSHHLREALRRRIPEIRFNSRVVDLVPHDGVKGGVYVVLHDGSTEWGDVVVGADGMHSTIRGFLYPGQYVGTSSRSLGMTVIDGFVDMPRCPEGFEHPVELWGHRRTVSVTPLYRAGLNRLCYSATLYEPPKALVDVASETDGMRVREMLRGLMKREFDSFSDGVSTMLGNADLALPVEVLEVPVMPRWFNKRAVLIGEAAHGSVASFLQQDPSLCVEDAALLATALIDVPLLRDSGFEYAFAQYESVRRDRVERYVRQSRRARRFTATKYTALRDAVLWATPSAAVNLSQRWLSRWTYSAQQLAVDPKIKMETAFR